MIRLDYPYSGIEIQTYSSGVMANADSLVGYVYKEGVITNITPSISAQGSGRYLASFTTYGSSSGWSESDHVTMIADATIGGTSYRSVVFDSIGHAIPNASTAYVGELSVSGSNHYYSYDKITNVISSGYSINCVNGNSHGIVGIIASSGDAVKLNGGRHSLSCGSINCVGTAFHATGASRYLSATANEIYAAYLIDVDAALDSAEFNLNLGKVRCTTSLIKMSSASFEANIRDSMINVDGSLIEDEVLSLTSILRFYNSHITADIACTQGRVEFYNCTVDGTIDFTSGQVFIDSLTNIDQAGVTGTPSYLNNQTNSIFNLLSSGVNVTTVSSGAVQDIFSTYVIDEAYASQGAAGTPAQILYLTQQAFTDFAISGITIYVKGLDGSTTVANYTMDSAVTPTSRNRSS